MTRCFDVFLDLCLNKRLSKQSGRRWLETPSCSLKCHCNEEERDGGWVYIISNIRYVEAKTPRYNGRHFANGIFKWFFLNEKVWISSMILLKCVPRCPIYNKPAVVQIMACHQAASCYLNQWWPRLLTVICVTWHQRVQLKRYMFGFNILYNA